MTDLYHLAALPYGATEIEPTRIVVFVLASLACFLWALRVGVHIISEGWAWRLTNIGVVIVLGGVAFGQIKASALGVPVDGLTLAFVIGLTFIVAGLAIRSIRHEGA